MSLSKISKLFIGIGIVVVLSGAVVPAIVIPLHNRTDSITVTLLENAGVLIEVDDTRIYIDPINLLLTDYADLAADAILITHPHGDHYDPATINALQKDGTLNVFPSNMSSEIALHDGFGVSPEDHFTVGDISITAFYMYTFPVDPFPASHPQEANWTSYIVDIDGFTLFHAGDSKSLDEYAALAGTIDVALLPLGPGCQTMADYEIIDALGTLEAKYFIPIHFEGDACSTFISSYDTSLSIIDCEPIALAHFTSYVFD